MSSYRMIELTNSVIGAVAANANIPLGVPVRAISQQPSCKTTFYVTTNVNTVVSIQEAGFYKIIYTGYLTVGEAGTISLNLLIGGDVASTAEVTASVAGTYPVSLNFITRVYNNCALNATNLPTGVQLVNTGTALTGGTSTLIIERVSAV